MTDGQIMDFLNKRAHYYHNVLETKGFEVDFEDLRGELSIVYAKCLQKFDKDNESEAKFDTYVTAAMFKRILSIEDDICNRSGSYSRIINSDLVSIDDAVIAYSRPNVEEEEKRTARLEDRLRETYKEFKELVKRYEKNPEGIAPSDYERAKKNIAFIERRLPDTLRKRAARGPQLRPLKDGEPGIPYYCKRRETVKRMYQDAVKIVKIEGGYRIFYFIENYEEWLSQKKEEAELNVKVDGNPLTFSSREVFEEWKALKTAAKNKIENNENNYIYANI